MSSKVHTQAAKPEAATPTGAHSTVLLAGRPFRRAQDDVKDNDLSGREQSRYDTSFSPDSPNPGHNLGRISILPLRAAGIQPKLKISKPNDSYEQEADRVADTVMRMPEPAIQRQNKNEEEETVQTKCDAGGTPELTPNAESQIASLQGGGQPLPGSVRSFFEPRFGHDFSQVRVHSGAAADQSARNVSAYAYTVGNNIVFGAGQFSPGSLEGRHLIAHELTHVVQQANQSGLHNKQEMGWADDPFRREADSAATRVLNDQPLMQSSFFNRQTQRLQPGIIRRQKEPKPKEPALLKVSAVEKARAALIKMGLPTKLVPRSTVSWTFDPKTGDFVLGMPKQLTFGLPPPSKVFLKIGPELTGTISYGKLIVKKGFEGAESKSWIDPWVNITQVEVKGPNVVFQHFSGPTVVPIEKLPDF